MSAERATHSSAFVDRETDAELADPPVYLALDRAVVLETMGGQAVEHIGDQVGDIPELRFAEAARRSRRRPTAAT